MMKELLLSGLNQPQLLPILESFEPSPDELLPSSSSILELLRIFSESKATDPRDRIYALLGILRDITSDKFYPGYEESLLETSRRFSAALVANGLDIEALYYVCILNLGFPDKLDDVHLSYTEPAERSSLDASLKQQLLPLPSWTINWTSPSLPDYIRFYQAGYQWIYHTATNLDIQLSLIERDVLKTRGLCLDTCSQLGKVAVAMGTKTWKPFFEEVDHLIPDSRTPYFTGESWFEVQWRTMVADRSRKQTPAPDEFAQHYRHIRRWCRGEIMKNMKVSVQTQLVGITNPVMNSIINLAKLYKLCRTQKGYVGLVSISTSSTDKIVIIRGAEMPFVLRPSEKRAGFYEFIGACYIHGLMQGEVFDLGYVESDILIH
jgi:hypothetical protein